MARRSSRLNAVIGVGLAVLVIAASHGHLPHRSGGGAARGATRTAVYSSNEALANQMAASGYGWTGNQAACLDELWTRESAGTWSPTVTSPTSGAYGIPQSLPAGKMAAAGPDWQTNPATQVRSGLAYVRSTYGTPCGAWAHEEADGWY